MLDLAKAASVDVAIKLIENALEDAVSCIDGFGRGHCAALPAKMTSQNIDATRGRLLKEFGVDIVVGLDSARWKLVCDQFQKRHVLAPQATVGRQVASGASGQYDILACDCHELLPVSSAVTLAQEFHVDGFRVDLPQALYEFNALHGDGLPVPAANAFGAEFMHELTRTLKMIRPQCVLIAENHSNLSVVPKPTDGGGLGFDASWYSSFYHHLIGNGNCGEDFAWLLHVAGFGSNDALALDYFAGALGWSGNRKVVYHEDHDDAGKAD